MDQESEPTPEPGEAAAVWVDIDALMPWADNPRINAHAVPGLVKSIKRWGFGAPVIARKENGEIIAGHTRVMAARELGLRQVPVRYLDLDPAEAHLLAIADNKLAEKSNWDDRAVLDLLGSYSLEDAELAGFDAKELDELAKELLAADHAPPERDDPGPSESAPRRVNDGDVWTLGDHRLVCGSSTDGKSVALALDGRLADLVLTDPPYGVSYVGKTKAKKPVHNDDAGGLVPLLRAAFAAALTGTHKGAVWYVWGPPGPTGEEFHSELRTIGVLRQCLVWVKSCMVLGHSDYHYKHEQIFYGWTPGAAHASPPNRSETSVWEFDNPNRSEAHPTMKPVEMFEHALNMSSNPGDLVLDMFLGSGTSIIAAEKTGRICAGVEFSPEYCDGILDRWEKLTGKEAVLAHG